MISSSDSKKATYQESVTARLSREHDDEDLPQDADAEIQSSIENLNGVLSGIQKVSVNNSQFISSDVCGKPAS